MQVNPSSIPTVDQTAIQAGGSQRSSSRAESLNTSTLTSSADSKGFCSTVLDAALFIPRKIMEFFQWIFCCGSSVEFTTAGFIDNPAGFLRAGAKNPEKMANDLIENLLADPKNLLTLIQQFTDPTIHAPLLKKLESIKAEDRKPLFDQMAKVLLDSTLDTVLEQLSEKAMQAAMEMLPSALPALAKEIGNVLVGLREQLKQAQDSPEKTLLLRYLDRALPEIAQLEHTLPGLVNEYMQSQLALSQVPSGALNESSVKERAKNVKERAANAEQALREVVIKAFVSVPTQFNPDDFENLESAQQFAGKQFQEEMPILMAVIMGSFATPVQEVVPGLKLDLQTPLAELVVNVVGKMVLDIAGELGNDMPLAKIVYPHLEGFLKDQEKVGKYAAGLITHFLGNMLQKPNN